MNTWIKRSAAVLATATAGLALMGPTAQAGQATVNFTVSTTVFAACTASSGGTMKFPNYTSGQASAATTEMDIDITCLGSGSGGSNPPPVPVTLQFLPVTPATFNLSIGGGGTGTLLPYSICDGAACSGANAFTPNSLSNSVSVNGGATASTYQLYGSIAGGLTPPVGAYTQVVDGFVNF